MTNTYTFDKDKTLVLKSEVLPEGTVTHTQPYTYTWKINNINKNSNTQNLTINTTTDLKEGKNTISLVVVCEHGTVSPEYVAEIYIGTPILRPVLTSMTPSETTIGQDVTITLTGRDFTQTAYPNVYIDGKFIDHGTVISNSPSQIVFHRIFTSVEKTEIRVNNRNSTLSLEVKPFKVNLVEKINPVKIKIDKPVTLTVTDSITNLPVKNISVELNNITKLTDPEGKVTFN
jgi:hypothetical protein